MEQEFPGVQLDRIKTEPDDPPLVSFWSSGTEALQAGKLMESGTDATHSLDGELSNRCSIGFARGQD